MRIPTYILPVIVFAQFCCTSLWFASNAVLPELTETFQLPLGAIGYLTAVVQLGFIVGTLLFALFTLSDRFSPSKVFFICALLGAATNLSMLWQYNTLTTLLVIRFMTGFFLAGIYPVGMKIAADYYDKGLGKSLGYLVGALVLGTAFPHVLSTFFTEISWKWVVIITSCVTVLGGLLMLVYVPNGPYRKAALAIDLKAITQVFKHKNFRSAAFGYFGHMWELYAFWAFIPFILTAYNTSHQATEINVSLWSFILIGIGSVGCALGGNLSQRYGARKVAIIAILLSGLCCIVSPLFFETNHIVFLLFLLFWGVMVITDSPMFSTLVAQNSVKELKGTALTIVNCIGFAITIVSIQLLSFLAEAIPPQFIFMVLGLGPIFGLIALRKPNDSKT